MSRLALRLLGPIEITFDGRPLTRFETEKERALLLYLAAEFGRTHSRDVLAEMLWPDRPEGAARANLRHAIYNLRGMLGDRSNDGQHTQTAPFLLVQRNTIELNEQSAIWLDTQVFLRLLTERELAEPTAVSRLEEAEKLYRGTFLDGLVIGDSAGFQEWLLVKREQYERLALNSLGQLAQLHEFQGEVAPALKYARRLAELAPWDEKAQVYVLRLLALSGRRAEALALFERYKQKLAEELEVEPGHELLQIVQQIRNDGQGRPNAAVGHTQPWRPDLTSPGFLDPGNERRQRPIFVLRQRELAKLDALLQHALKGQSGLAFVTGGPGLGKSALLNEFSHQAMKSHPLLLVANASCSAFDHIGDSYLPFRDIMRMLIGDVLSLWKAGTIDDENARRLWQARELSIQAILEKGNSLIDTIIDGDELLAYTAAALPDDTELLRRLAQVVRRERSSGKMPDQRCFFEQFTEVLKFEAGRHPLLLLIDDLQWLDRASTSLLFHLGRRLIDSRVLIVCAYRPEDITFESGDYPGSLASVLNQFKRTNGDVWVKLTLDNEQENRQFIDAYLDTEPNQLKERFRASLLELTRGHPLFTAELLRSMQERGDLVYSETGWLEGPKMGWETIPARIEAVIEQRISRLDSDLRKIMTTASVEGDVFTVQVLAHLLEQPARILMEKLAGELEARYGLVSVYKVENTGPVPTLFYGFHHALIRNYLYEHIGEPEKRLLHLEVAAALEHIYGPEDDETVVKIAQHFYKAGDYGRALPYIIRAARLANRRYVYEEAIDLYSQAIELAQQISADNVSLAGLLVERGIIRQTVGAFEEARCDMERAVQISRLVADKQGEWQALLESGRLWTSRNYEQASAYFAQSLALARQLDDPLLLAESLNWIGNRHLNAENPPEAIAHHLEALEIYEQHGTAHDLANTLDLLGIASQIGVDPFASLAYYDRAIALFRDLDDRPRLACSLIGRAALGSAGVVTQCCPLVVTPWEARKGLEESLTIAREIGASSEQAWALWLLSMLNTAEGKFEDALKAAKDAVKLASETGHLEWLAGSKCALACALHELFELDEAEQDLLEVMLLARELCSRHWLNMSTDRLAALYLAAGACSKAEAVLKQVIGPGTPMDSLAKCLCWARQAEVSLQKGDSVEALAIMNRLLASILGKKEDNVIPSFWLIRAEALAALGDLDQSLALLQAAISQAQKMGSRMLFWRLHSSLGDINLRMGNYREADAQFAAAQACVGELSDAIHEATLKRHFQRNANRAIERYRKKSAEVY